MKDLIAHPIRAFALLVVAVIAAYVMWMGYRINEILAGPSWCRTALGAEKSSATDGTIKGLDACVGLLTVQLKSLATNSHILFGVVAGCLLVLVVIVLAGGKFAFGVSKGGATGSIAPADAVPVQVVNPPADPVPTAPQPAAPEYRGPGMPEPKGD